MGVPAPPLEQTDTTQDGDTAQHDPPPKLIGTEDDVGESAKDASDIVDKGNLEMGNVDKGSVLDENANMDFKVEKLHLEGLTGNDAGQENSVQPKAEGKETASAMPEKHDLKADRKQTAHGMNNGEDLSSTQDGDQPENGEEEGEEEEEEEEEPPTMTAEERKEMHEAVKAGDIDLLEDLLEKPNADINMVYFNENLLVTALRADQQQMAEFLLDNGVDQNFAATFMVPPTSSSGKGSQKKALEVYKYPCRQMAYDKGFLGLVEIIDILNGRLFPGVKPVERIPRYRRPPPTPSCSSPTLSDSDTSSVSGDESDVSEEVRNDVDVGEDGRAELDSSRTVSTSRDADQRLLTVPKKKLKKKKAKGTSEVDGGEIRSENDSGVPEDRKKKRRKKAEDGEVVETASARADDEASTSRRSGVSQAEGEVTDRSRVTTKSSVQSGEGEGEGEAGVNDEGYETMSPSPSHPPATRQQQQQASRFQPPSIPVKPNKAFLALRRSTDTHKQHCIPAKYNEARPLHWKKVKSAGSYEVESPLWHQPTVWTPKLPPPTPAGTATTVSMLSPRSGITSQSERSERSTSLVSTIELNTGNVTKPKIMQPSQRIGSSKSSGTGISSTSSGVGTGTTNTSPSINSAYVPNNDRLYPLKLKVPGYMRMTTSCFVKRRLQPNFTNSYSSLDFVEPGPAGFRSVRGTEDTLSKSSWANSEGSVSLSRKSVTSSRTGGSGALPSVLDLSSSLSPTMSRKKNFGVGGVGNVDCVPNIRNNSSVIQTSKLTSVSPKVR